MALNNRAWIKATGPFTGRDPERAVVLARRAVELAPGVQLTLNTLGVVLYRGGSTPRRFRFWGGAWPRGKASSTPSTCSSWRWPTHGLGRREPARGLYDRAVRWLGTQKGLSESYTKELTAFRAEAQSVLAGPAGDLPADVFAPGPMVRP